MERIKFPADAIGEKAKCPHCKMDVTLKEPQYLWQTTYGVTMNTRLKHVQNWRELAQQANCSPARLAKKPGVSLRTLERHFVKEIGASPKTWCTMQRQCRAIELLRETMRARSLTWGSLI